MAKTAGLLAILGGPKPSGDDSPEGGEASGKEAAVRDMFDAMKAGDFAAAAEAFHRAYMECAAKEREEEDAEGGGYPPEVA